MLILSQDKKEIVNLDNITNMFILNNTVKCMLTYGGETYIGVYDTEERAKEVLQDIIKAYISDKKSQEANSMFGYSIIPSNTYYEMPEK